MDCSAVTRNKHASESTEGASVARSWEEEAAQSRAGGGGWQDGTHAATITQWQS